MEFTTEKLILHFDDVGDLNLIENGVLKKMQEDIFSWREEKKELRIIVAERRGIVQVNARPIGKDWLDGCFVCKDLEPDRKLMWNICLMCKSQERGRASSGYVPRLSRCLLPWR